MNRAGAMDLEFEKLVRAHTPTLRRYCRRLAGPTDGDDLMQETLTRAMTQFGTLRDTERFLPWCRQIARNANARRVQTIRPTESLEDQPTSGDMASQIVERLFLRAELDACLAELPEHSRRVLLARAEGVAPAALATELGVSRRLVDTWFFRSRAKVREHLRHLIEVGSVGGPALRGTRFFFRRRLAAVPIIVAAGVGITALVLLAPHTSVPAGRAATFPSATTSATTIGPSRPPAATAPRSPTPAPPSVAAGVRAPTPAPTRAKWHALGLPRTSDRQAIIDAALAQPIVVGPLLPDNQLLVGFDPCGLLGALGFGCPPPVAAIRVHVGPHA